MMNRFLKISFFFICAGVLFLGTNSFSAIVTTKPSASTTIKPSHPMASETWYGTSFSSSKFTPSKLVSSLNKMTWYTAYINYHNSEYPLSSAENIAADSSGNLYICWVNDDNELNLSTNKTGLGEWEVEKIADDVHSCAHISLDSSGNIHMISYSSDTGYYRHITGTSNSWTITNLGTVADAVYMSFAIDSSGTVHISYFDQTNWILKYATSKTGTLIAETVDSTYRSGYDSQIVVDSSNIPHISYFDASTDVIKYATQSSGSWVTESIDDADEALSDSSITVDSKGYVHIAYTGINSSGNPVPKYATNKSGSWKKRSLEIQLVQWEYAEYDKFSHFSIALDAQENVHVSYDYEPLSGSNINRTNTLKYATNKDGQFKSYTVADSTVFGAFTKVIVTSLGPLTLSKNTSVPVLASLKATTTTPILSSPSQKVAIVYGDYSSSLYNIHYASPEEITDTCQDFTLTLTDADCDGTDDSEEVDSDGDGITNDDDTDDDGDGIEDTVDSDYIDTDGDGTVDSADPDQMDSDADGTVDSLDDLPNDATETIDSDDDGIGNNADTDDDGDGFLDDVDPNPTTFDADTDHDGIPDCTDDDDDGDGTPDESDPDHPDYYQDELSDIDDEGSF